VQSANILGERQYLRRTIVADYQLIIFYRTGQVRGYGAAAFDLADGPVYNMDALGREFSLVNCHSEPTVSGS
jgi:hypothetical protein